MQGPSIDLNSQEAYDARFGMLRKAMQDGSSLIAAMRSAVDGSRIVTSSDYLTAANFREAASKVSLYDMLLEEMESDEGFKRPSVVELGVIHQGDDPFFYNEEDVVDWLGAYANYLSDKKNPEVISAKDMSNFVKLPLCDRYRIANPDLGERIDASLETFHNASMKVLYHSLLTVARGLNAIAALGPLANGVDSYLDRKFFDKYKYDSSGKL